MEERTLKLDFVTQVCCPEKNKTSTAGAIARQRLLINSETAYLPRCSLPVMLKAKA